MIRWRDPDAPPEDTEGEEPSRWADPGGHLSMWAGVYGVLATYGYASWEVDLMECWTAALYMGHGQTGDEDPVLRGSRMVSLPKDDEPDGATDLLTKGDPHAATRAAALAADGERPVVAMRPQKPADR